MFDLFSSFDYTVLHAIREHLQCSFLDVVMPVVSFLADAGWFWILCAIVCLCFRSTRKMGITVGLALLLGVILGNAVLKNLFDRIRPYAVEGYEAIREALLIRELTDGSFPSGHTTASFAAALSFTFYRRDFGIAAFVLAFLIAFSRLYLFVHYPTDIFAGILVGLFCAALAYCIVATVARTVKDKKLRSSEKSS